MHILNFANKIEIKQSDGKGRGVFATEKILKGEHVIIEQPIGLAKNPEKSLEISVTGKFLDLGSHSKLLANLNKVCDLRGIQALRLGYLTDGNEKPIPDLNIFLNNHYKHHEIKGLSAHELKNIIDYNSFGTNQMVNQSIQD